MGMDRHAWGLVGKKSVYTEYAQYTYRDDAVLEADLRIRLKIYKEIL